MRKRKVMILGSDKILEVPVIQGGMGVGVSMGGLAGAVAAEGGMGCISTADCGYSEDDFYKNPMEANLRALKKEIAKAREISKNRGLVAINAMTATVQFADAVKTAVKEGIDAVISGAGLPLELPKLAEGSKTLIAPVVSSAKAAAAICKSWHKKYDRLPDFVVLEGVEAGGHLGFAVKDIIDNAGMKLENILSEVSEALQSFEAAAGRKIPVFTAGGIWSSLDAKEIMEKGATGVQIATRFIGTHECDASKGYKDFLIQATGSDLEITQSPVGMPARAINSPLLKRIKESRIAPTHCSRCIKTCTPSTTPYCITDALIAAVKGDVEHGLFFSGSNISKLTEITSVKKIMDEFRNLAV